MACLASPAKYDIFWGFNETTFPCRCCSPLMAIDEGRWQCEGGQSWFVTESGRFTPEKPFALDMPFSWADLVDEEETLRLESETAQARAARLAAEEAGDAERRLGVEASLMASYADLKKVTCSVGKGQARHIKKVPFPCKWLYCDEKAPKSQWRKNEVGKLCAPRLNHLTGAECWAHEYTDPKRYAAALKGGKTEEEARAFAHTVKHTCDHIHPGEAGWLPQWENDARYRPDRVAEGLASMRGVVAPVAPVAVKATRFAALSVAAPAAFRPVLPDSGRSAW